MSNIIEITDFNAPELDIYARLTEGQLLNRHQPEKGIFIAESPKVVERALDAGCVPISFFWNGSISRGRPKASLPAAAMFRFSPQNTRCSEISPAFL